MAATVKKRVQKYGFASLSEYIRFLLELDEELISPAELLAMSKRADREYKAGKLKKLSSLEELL